MSHAIVQALSRNEDTALADAIAWMGACRHATPEGWIAYSKSMAAVLEHLPALTPTVPARDLAQAIVRYMAVSWTNLTTGTWHTPAFFEFYRTFEQWQNIPVDAWMELANASMNTTALYQWSLDNQRAQEQLLQSKYPKNLSYEPLHTYIARTNLEHAFEERPLLLDTSVHWNLWTLFGEESLGLRSACFSRQVCKLAMATPISFEHAITECYQQASWRFNQKSCRALLDMDFASGHALTTCCGVLLLYHRFRTKGRRVLSGVQKRYPGLLHGFEIHLGVYGDIDNALLHANALMEHWQRIVLHQGSANSIELPSNILD